MSLWYSFGAGVITSEPEVHMEILPSITTSLPTNPVSDLISTAAEWFKLDVTNGNARKDTIRTYLSHVRHWARWCSENGVSPAAAAPDDVKRYRRHLGKDGLNLKQRTISLKLTSIRRFYQSAVDREFIARNPAVDIKADKDREAREEIKHLSAGQAELLFRAIPEEGLRSMRDRMMLVMMTIEGLRRVEIRRMNLQDLIGLEDPEKCKVLVRGKGKNAFIYPREDTIEMLKEYLAALGSVAPDKHGEPVFTSIDKGNTPRRRLSRGGINKIVDRHLEAAGVKPAGKSCHALRHTCGYLIYKETKDLRVVQEVLRHSDLEMAAKYADVDAQASRYTRNIRVKFK